jgi:predicted CXXCH cytochrome family protein
LALLLAAAVLPGSDAAIAEVRNSKHDFSSAGTGGIWGSSDIDQVCVFCHTPHDANLNAVAPLWNREVPSAVFALYESGTRNASVQQPGPNTLACLGCHDGSIAIDMIAHGNPGGSNMMAIGDVYYPGSPYGEGGANIGGNYSGNPNVNNLSDDHPVSFVYDSALAAADGGLVDPASLPADLPLFQNRLECSTCHDVHNSHPANPALLRITPAGGALCLSCHRK